MIKNNFLINFDINMEFIYFLSIKNNNSFFKSNFYLKFKYLNIWFKILETESSNKYFNNEISNL